VSSLSDICSSPPPYIASRAGMVAGSCAGHREGAESQAVTFASMALTSGLAVGDAHAGLAGSW
jgi:hypothetical protein